MADLNGAAAAVKRSTCGKLPASRRLNRTSPLGRAPPPPAPRRRRLSGGAAAQPSSAETWRRWARERQAERAESRAARRGSCIRKAASARSHADLGALAHLRALPGLGVGVGERIALHVLLGLARTQQGRAATARRARHAVDGRPHRVERAAQREGGEGDDALRLLRRAAAARAPSRAASGAQTCSRMGVMATCGRRGGSAARRSELWW